MRVARSFGAGEVRIEEVEDPEPGPGEVGLRGARVRRVRLGRDRLVRRRPKLPAVLGHEPVGVVSAVGEGVTAVAVGDRVAIHHHAPCGECRRCRRGHETICERFRATRLDPGGFAERVRLVPPSWSPSCSRSPTASTRSSRRSSSRWRACCAPRSAPGLRPGDSLLVVGAGVNGLLQIAAAHARAVDAVWVREPRPERLALRRGLRRRAPRQRAGRRRDRLHAEARRDRRRRSRRVAPGGNALPVRAAGARRAAPSSTAPAVPARADA